MAQCKRLNQFKDAIINYEGTCTHDVINDDQKEKNAARQLQQSEPESKEEEEHGDHAKAIGQGQQRVGVGHHGNDRKPHVYDVWTVAFYLIVTMLVLAIIMSMMYNIVLLYTKQKPSWYMPGVLVLCSLLVQIGGLREMCRLRRQQQQYNNNFNNKRD
eukprot:138220_1